MKRLLGGAILLAAGCAAVDLRGSPSRTAYALAPERVAPIASVEFKDLAGGLRQDGTHLVLKRPFVDSFRDAALARLAALNVPVGTAGGAVVRVEVTESTLTRGRGFNADLTGTVKYALRVLRDGREVCVREASGWAVVHETLTSSPERAVLDAALSKAADDLGPALASSCLYTAGGPGSAAPAPAAVRDPALIAVVIGVERRRGAAAPVAGAASDAKDFAAVLKTALGAGDGRVVLLVDDGASLADLNKTLEHWLPDHIAPGDRVVVYFAGQGARDARGDAYLVPFDGDAAYLDSTAFPLSRLLAGLGRLPATSTVVLDASFSGTGGRTLAAPDGGESAAALPPGVTVLRASSPGQAAGAADGHGRFTAALLRALNERGGDLSSAFDAAAPGLTDQKPLRRSGR